MLSHLHRVSWKSGDGCRYHNLSRRSASGILQGTAAISRASINRLAVISFITVSPISISGMTFFEKLFVQKNFPCGLRFPRNHNWNPRNKSQRLFNAYFEDVFRNRTPVIGVLLRTYDLFIIDEIIYIIHLCSDQITMIKHSTIDASLLRSGFRVVFIR